MERDVDRGDRSLQHAAALEILAAIRLLPDRADVERVPSNDEPRIMLERTGDRHLASAKPTLAPAEDACVGLDLDDQLVPRADPNGIRLDRCDLHHQLQVPSQEYSPSQRSAGCQIPVTPG